MTQSEFQQIFFRLQHGEATKEQMDSFLDALQNQSELESYFQELLKDHFLHQETIAGHPYPYSADNALESKALDQLLAHTWKVIDQQTAAPEMHLSVPSETGKKPRRPIRPIQWVAAASILVLLGLGAAILIHSSKQTDHTHLLTTALKAARPSSILPGKSAAVLTLASGTKIVLDSTVDQSIKKGNHLIAYNEAGKIDYQAGTYTATEIQYNTLTTEKGNRYQLILPDGTKAWLNAESSIRFPDRFPEGQRTVSITGEVYFEVQHDQSKPFVVQVKGQTIRDIGTAFNVNAYEDEPSIKTTLIEGIIEVNDTRLKPGWQAAIRPGGKMTIDKNADLAEAISWKNNTFLFHQTDMGSILRQIARWYDVRILYKGTFDQTFTGGISRQTSLDEILKILSFSNKIKFEVHDRNIIVQPN